MGKQKHSKVKGFLNFSCEAEIHAVPTTWDEWFPTLRESMRKPKHSKVTYFTWIRNPYNSRPAGKANSHIMEQVWENTDNSLVLLYFTDLGLMKTHVILTVWECTNSHNMEVFCWKPYHSEAVGFWGN